MGILRLCLIALILNMIYLTEIFAFENSKPSDGKRSLNFQVHGSGGSTNNLAMTDVLKKQRLERYSAKTIGEAFDSYRYFASTEWKEFPDEHQKTYVTFTGKMKKSLFSLKSITDDVSTRKIEATFVIHNSGSYGLVMLTVVELQKNGSIQKKQLTDFKEMLDSIYANREISFK